MNDRAFPADRTPAHLVALFFDLGDTITVEESEIKDAERTTMQADLISGIRSHRHHSWSP